MAFIGWWDQPPPPPPPTPQVWLLILEDTGLRRSCFSKCFSVDFSEAAWCQSQLNLWFAGFGLQSLSRHSSAAFIASLCSSGFATADNHHLIHAVNTFNDLHVVSPSDTNSPVSTIRDLSPISWIVLLSVVCMAHLACLLSVSASLATLCISVLPSGEPSLNFDPSEFRTAITWWRGLETTRASSCLLCPEIALDPLGHHALSYRQGGDVVLHRNQLRVMFVDLCHKANFGVKVEASNGLLHNITVNPYWWLISRYPPRT